MNVGSIYRASHILPMQPLRGDQDAAQTIGWHGNSRDTDSAGTGIRSVANASVSKKGQRSGRALLATV